MDKYDATEQAYKKGYAAAMDKQKWIPVTERLPNEENVLVCAGGCVGEAFLIKGNFYWQECAGDEYWCEGDCIIEGVTHWMPLPPAPEDVK